MMPNDSTTPMMMLWSSTYQLSTLIPDESSVDILYYPAFQQMRINKKRLLPSDTPLEGFSGTKVFPVGTITLLVTIDTPSTAH